MASYFLPSFLSGWDLSSVSAFSLSANLQKRILSYLLKRTLGHLVDGGQLDLAQIDAGIGSGRIEVRNIQLDADAINSRLPSLPITFVAGEIGRILIQLPVPNFWSGELSITVSDISVRIKPAPQDPTRPFNPTEDLAASFASAASHILVEDEEANQLEQSIHQSLSPEDLQHTQQQTNEEKGSMIATYVEALLTRLKVAIENVQLHLESDAVDLSFMLKSANLHSSNTRSDQRDPSNNNTLAQDSAPKNPGPSQRRFMSETVRTLELQDIELWLRDKRQPSGNQDPSSSFSSESSFQFPDESFGRSQAVQNMDQSTASLQESSASLYESAVGASAFQEAPERPNETFSAPAATSLEHLSHAGTQHLLFSMGQEPVTLTLRTIKERQEMPAPGIASRRTDQRLVGFSTNIDVQIGNAAAVFFIDHASLLMTLARMISHSSASAKAPSSPTQAKSQSSPLAPSPSVPRKIALSCEISSFNLIIGYEDPTADSTTLSSLAAFWARPSRSHPDFGHLRLRCDKLVALFADELGSIKTAQTQPKLQVTIDDLGLFEHLPASLFEPAPSEASRLLPILILDPNLVHSTDTSTRTPRNSRRDYASSTVDVFDWRYSVPHSVAAQRPAGAANENSSSARAARFTAAEGRPNPSLSGASPYFRTAYGDRGWKLKPSSKASTTSQGNRSEAAPPSITVSVFPPKKQEDTGHVITSVAPVHCFVDISLVTRLMPALRRFAAAQLATFQDTDSNHELTDSIATLATSVATIQASDLLEDLATSAATGKESAYSLDLKISLVRLDIRTPKVSYDPAALAGRDLNSTRRSGLERRSGILVLQVQGLDVRSGLSETQKASGGVRFAPASAARHHLQDRDPIVTGRVGAEKISAYLALPLESRALVFALVETCHDDQLEQGPFANSPSKLLPRVHFSSCPDSRPDRGEGQSCSYPLKDRCSLSVPSIKVELGKGQLDSLQYMADDLTQSINLWNSEDLDESDSLDAEGLKILGSRFFGSRAGMSIMSASTDSTATARPSTKNSSLLVTITEASIRLWLPGLTGDATTAGSKIARPKSLLLVTSDFELLSDTDKARSITRIEVRVPQMQLSVEAGSASEETSSSLLAFRTMEKSLDDRDRNTMLLLVLEAYAEPGTSYREQNVDLTLCSVTLAPSFDQELIPRVKRLFQAPAGVFENVEPNEVTRISFKAKDCSIYVAPPHTGNRAAVAIGEASVKTKLTSHAPKTAVKLAIGNLDLFAIESEVNATSSHRSVPKSASDHWSRSCYARLVHIPESKGSINFNTLTRPEVDVRITKLRVKLQATADTLGIVTDLVGAITATQASASEKAASEPTLSQSESTPPAPSKRDGSRNAHTNDALSQNSPLSDGHFDRMAELMSGIEDNAYRLATPLPVEADLVDDDVPSDAAFLGAKGRYHPEIVETTLDSDEFFGGESVASLSLLAPRTDTVIFADEDVTVRLLDPKGIRPVREYFTDPGLQPHVESALGPTASSVRVRVSNFDLSIRLHSGYDWSSTRKAVQQEAKLVRKRLQKIKQLLAAGQVPDDSVEAATSNLLDSIHMSLPNIPAEMDPEEMMQAVEEEFGDHSDAASTADSDATASWQTLPTVRRDQRDSRSGSSAASSASGTQQSKLQRSARSLIDFNFRGLEVEFDKADPSQPSHIVSRIAVNARKFEIIDNIKTSTWRTFLTEMQDRNAALRHDTNTESKMVKVEILNVRPQGDVLDDVSASETPEVRMRAKISPLRLHVDQDALDFLKKFFTFKAPGQKAPPPVSEPTGPPLPFVQFAEVLPIKIKLDYKPKRVDYNLLRQGKTIELMNFFHFEGSEMVLRHITLRGINGWARLFDTLNDIWTPDVKANQLADFLSGLGPIRSLVNVGAGLADLVLLPIEQYHKDGRVLRGMQKGATSFAKSTALEAVKLGARLATGTQVILEQAEHILGGEMAAAVTARAVGPDSSSDSYASLSESIMVSSTTSGMGASWVEEKDESMVSRYASQPDNMRDALSQAYSGLTEGLTSAAQTILAIPMEVYEPDSGSTSSSGAGGSGGGAAGSSRPVVKAVPIAILRGARGATQAIAKTMQGVQVTLGDSENVKEGKYKLPSNRGR